VTTRTRVYAAAIALAALELAAAGGCGRNRAPEATGEIRVLLTQAPSDVHCVRITVAGPTGATTSSSSVTPGQSTVLSLTGLPLGQVTLAAQAFSAACTTTTGTPTWVSLPVTLVLVSGSPANVTLTMERPGQITVSVDFPGDGGALAQPPPSSQTVSAGGVATSQSFKMVYTVGQPTQNQDKSSSATRLMRGGLQGANGSDP
jgi:hypothetical protein